MSANDIAGHPRNWPAKSRQDPRAPVQVTGIMLRNDDGDIVVEVERDGRWYEVIREVAGGAISHIVEPSGIRNAPLSLMPARQRETGDGK